MSLSTDTRHILLADDDTDDTSVFRDVLEELPFSTRLTIVHNGEQLMDLLHKEANQLPDILFLDLNMPRKNGFECLEEIKKDERLKHLPIIIFTTSNEPAVINLLYKRGAQYYIRKPNNIGQLKKLLQLALTLTHKDVVSQLTEEDFILSIETVDSEKKK